jgi:hypothetical protein
MPERILHNKMSPQRGYNGGGVCLQATKMSGALDRIKEEIQPQISQIHTNKKLRDKTICITSCKQSRN